MPHPDQPRFFRTLLVVEILGNDRWGGDLESIGRDTLGGPYSATVRAVVTDEIDQASARIGLVAHGSDPGFLGADQPAAEHA